MKIFAPVFVALLLVVSCKNYIGIPDNFDYGKIENNVYVNEFFGMKMPLNEGWTYMEKDFVDSLRAEGLKDMVGDNKELEKTISAADIKTANLLSILHADTTVFQLYNPNISMIAENLKLALQVKNGKDYLEAAKSFMESSGVAFQFVGEIREYKIGGKEFYTMEVINTVQGVPIHQDFYAAVMNGFGLAIVGSWMDEDHRAIIRSELETITFD